MPEKTAPKIVPLPSEVDKIYEAVIELEQKYPGRRFTPDGHMVGSIGEVIAAEAFGLQLFRGSFPGHDAIDPEGRNVQIKLTAGDHVSMYATCDRLLVLRITSEKSTPRSFTTVTVLPPGRRRDRCGRMVNGRSQSRSCARWPIPIRLSIE